MKTFLQAASAIAVVAIIAGLGFLFGRYAYPKCPEVLPPRIDTVTIWDTLRIPPPPPDTMWLVRTEPARLPIADTVRDTVYIMVEVPIERKVYTTDDYRAEIEGFRPELISLDIYRRTQFIDRTQTIKVPDKKRWGIGIQAGYGVTLRDGRIVGAPFLGVGMQYNLVKW